jgi:ABC-2 type transport system ATP-binding protein
MAFFDNMTGMEFLKLIGDMRRTKDKTRRDSLIKRLELDPGGKIKKMSKGMKQKLGLITAFMHDPAVYILDEPSSGLDPLMQVKLMKLLEEEKSRGKTILMSSHIFEEVQLICDRAGIIREGRIVTIEDVKALNAMKREHYIVSLADASDVEKILASGLEAARTGDTQVSISVGKNYPEMFRLLAECNVTGLESLRQSLEDVFMKYYGKDGEN